MLGGIIMAGIEVQTGELVKNVKYKCLGCGKILDLNNDIVRPWFTTGKRGYVIQ